MKLALHVILKDLRRQWMEILGYCVAVCGWAWQEAHPGSSDWLRQHELFPISMFGLWFLVTVRAVQGESLVGDREWWPTRPYRWGQLLGAKTLLLAMVLNGPLFFAQLYLLMHAGVPMRWSLAPGLILLQAMFVLIVTFPAAVVASVTASVVQWVMSIVGIILAIMVCSWLPWDKLPPTLSGQEDVASCAIAFVVLPLMAAALVWQYARRREWTARIVLVAALVPIPLGILFASTAQVRRFTYPDAGSDDSMTLEIKPSNNGVREFDWRNGDEITIPVVDSTIGSDQAIQIDGYRLHLAGSGWHWESDWKNARGNMAFFDPDFGLSEDLPDWVFAQVKQGHATAQVDLAWESYRFNPPVRVQADANGFVVPGIGHCRMESIPDNPRFTIFTTSGGFECAAPLTLPPAYLIAIDSDGNQCAGGNGNPTVPPGHTAYSVDFGSSSPAYFDPDPVRRFSLTAGDWVPPLPPPQKPGDDGYRGIWVCPGGSFTVRTGQGSGRQSGTFNLGDIGVGKKIDETAGEGIVKFNPDSE